MNQIELINDEGIKSGGQAIDNIDWTSIVDVDPDVCVEKFIKIVNSAIDPHIHSKKLKIGVMISLG